MASNTPAATTLPATPHTALYGLPRAATQALPDRLLMRQHPPPASLTPLDTPLTKDHTSTQPSSLKLIVILAAPPTSILSGALIPTRSNAALAISALTRALTR